jgi:hypothetical protein
MYQLFIAACLHQAAMTNYHMWVAYKQKDFFLIVLEARIQGASTIWLW